MRKALFEMKRRWGPMALIGMILPLIIVLGSTLRFWSAVESSYTFLTPSTPMAISAFAGPDQTLTPRPTANPSTTPERTPMPELKRRLDPTEPPPMPKRKRRKSDDDDEDEEEEDDDD